MFPCSAKVNFKVVRLLNRLLIILNFLFYLVGASIGALHFSFYFTDPSLYALLLLTCSLLNKPCKFWRAVLHDALWPFLALSARQENNIPCQHFAILTIIYPEENTFLNLFLVI